MPVQLLGEFKFRGAVEHLDHSSPLEPDVAPGETVLIARVGGRLHVFFHHVGKLRV